VRRGVSGWYGGRDEACPVSTGGGARGGGARAAREPLRAALLRTAPLSALALFWGAADGPEVALLLDGNDPSSEEAVHLALAAALGVPASRLVVIAHE
jgi:hypothetical protein